MRHEGVQLMLTDREDRYCEEISRRISRLRAFLNSSDLAMPPDPLEWHSFISSLRGIIGNISNDGSFIASLLAKKFLGEKFGVDFDAAEKPQGAAGLDIELQTETGAKIVAEIKTTVPYQSVDFGAAQITALKKDFAKLSAAEAEHKFMFVTDYAAFNILKKSKYTKLMLGVRLVHLGTGEEYAARSTE